MMLAPLRYQHRGNLELFSSPAHFLQSKVRCYQSGIIALTRCEGEGCEKYTMHPRLHHFIHRRHRGSVGEERTCTRDDLESGRAENTGLGGSDPAFSRSIRPKVFRVPPAQTCARRVSTMQMSAISIP